MEEHQHFEGEKKDGEDEMSIAQILGIVKEYAHEAVKNWWIIGLFVLAVVGFRWWQMKTTPINYSSKLTFMLNEDPRGSQSNGFAALLGGGPAPGANLDKITELAKTQYLVFQALLTKTTVSGNSDFLANHIIDIHDLPRTAWRNTPSLSGGFRFKSDDIPKFDRTEAKALKSIYQLFVNKLYTTRHSKQTGIMTLAVTTRSEDLTIKMLDLLFQQLSDYYVSSSTQRQLKTRALVASKVDSLRALLEGREYKQAKYDDTHNNLLFKAENLPSQQLKRDVTMLTAIYGEALKNLETADFSVKNTTPFVQKIDVPMAPLDSDAADPVWLVIIAAIVGTLIGLLFVFGRKLYREKLKPAF